MQRFGDARDWFFERRFGLFLHFGIYAVNGWHEQDLMRRHIPRAEYGKLKDLFDPTAFDADAILDLAAEVGMEYVCLTTKHHDGFCLWDTAHTDFKSTTPPCGRDLVGELADACHRRDFPLGLYYSVVDWHHPNYPNQGRHHEIAGPEPGDQPDWHAYLEYLKSQVEELCTQYGEVKYFFWDMNVPEHEDPSINDRLRELQPSMVINDRGFDNGDFGTPEREYQSSENAALLAFVRPTEACNSVGAQSWGYRANEDYYSVRHLMQSLAGIMARGGNYLLNVGPDATGAIPQKAVDMLHQIGAWYDQVKEAFDGTDAASDLTDNRQVLLTRRKQTLYVIPKGPLSSEAIVLSPLTQEPVEARLLNTGATVGWAVDLLPTLWQDRQPVLRLCNLPADALAGETPIFRLQFNQL